MKIGIRPTIDGRERGVRASLEKQTMDMAKMAAELISSNLRDRDGNPVECVISDTCIGGVAESAACAEKFASVGGVCATLTVTPCWCYGNEVMDMDPTTPKAIWGLNGTERPGAVFLAAVNAAYTQKGIPVYSIYGREVQDATDKFIPDDVKEKILSFAKAAVAAGEMKGKSYLAIGGVSMGIAGSIVNPELFEKWLGMRCEFVDMVEIDRRIKENIYDKGEYEKALKWVKENCKEGQDFNAEQHTREQKDAEWEYTVKMAIIIRDMMIGNEWLMNNGFREEGLGHNAIASGFQGQRHWNDYLPNGDFSEAILCSSFDWNGIRRPEIVATENDCLNGVAMLFGHLLTNTASMFSDVRTFWSNESVKRVTGKELPDEAKAGIIHLINSGASCLDASGKQRKDGKPAMKPFWDISEQEAQACLDATVWSPANVGYFRGGGFSSTFDSEGGMPVTMCRVNWVDGLGPVLQLVEGYTVELPADAHKVLTDRTDRTWPTTWFTPVCTGEGVFKDAYSVMANWGANHGAINYGHIGHDLITLCAMLRIPVSMHNVSDERIFRPHSWASFGTKDLEAADYRACTNYGPLYDRKR